MTSWASQRARGCIALLLALTSIAPAAAAPPAPSTPLEALRQLVLDAPAARLVDNTELLRGAKLDELVQAARARPLGTQDVATFAQSAHPDLLRALERRAKLPSGFFRAVTRAVQFAGGNPFLATKAPEPGEQARLRRELEQLLRELVRLDQQRGSRLLPLGPQLVTGLAQFTAPRPGQRTEQLLRELVEQIPLLELERRHAYLQVHSAAELLAQLPSRHALARQRSLVNFTHLLQTLSRVHEGKLLVDVYAENMPAPHRLARYLAVAALGEGSYCLDDIARATVALLHADGRTPRDELLQAAGAGLAFVRFMQASDGEFYNFASLRAGHLVVNREGVTSRKGFAYWAARAVWALGEATLMLRERAPALAALAARTLERSLPRLEAPLRRYGEQLVVEGRRLPAWLLGGYADQTAVAVKGLLAYYRALPVGPLREQLAGMIRKYCEGLVGMQIAERAAPDYGRFLFSVLAPADHHLWGSHQVEALAQAGELLGQPAWVAAAARCADHYWGPRTLAALLAPGEAQLAYGVETVIAGLVRLFQATQRRAYAEAALRWASWFFGGNEARALIYDPLSGRGYDGITQVQGPEGRGVRYSVNVNAGAESTIEALLAMQAVAEVPGLEARLRAFLAARLPR